MSKNSPKTIHLKDYTPPTHLIDRVALDVRFHPEETAVSARLAVRPNPDSPASEGPLELDGESVRLVRIAVDGKELAAGEYSTKQQKLTIPHPPAGPFTLDISTLCSPKSNTELSGLYLSNGIYCTQCEAEGFRRITYFLDRPDVLSRFRVRIEAEKSEAPVLLANGNLIESGDIAGTGRHFAVWEDPFPKPCYLFAMVGGNLASVEDSFTTMSGRRVALRIYVEPGKENRCGWAMESIKKSMAWDEQAFGREYDLDIFMIVAVSMFNMGAMENKGLNVFNDKYVLALPDSATDTDYSNIEAIIAHEYFHNWTGNRITCRDWFQLCLKEGLTVFRDQEFTADQRSRPVERISDVRGLRSHQFVEDAGPLAHPVRPTLYREINNFYTATVYEKGAEVVRMLKTLLGPDNFRKGMDLYFTRHDGQAATIEDFVQCMSDASGRDLSQFFRWYEQAGTPEIVATGTHDAASKTYRLEITQTVPPTPGQPSKEPMLLPLAVGLVGRDGRDLPLRLSGGGKVERGVLSLTKSAETFVFENIGEAPVPSLNRGFSAPIKLVANLSAENLRFPAARDQDPFNRWQAVQTIATRLLVDNVAVIRAGRKAQEDAGLLDA